MTRHACGLAFILDSGSHTLPVTINPAVQEISLTGFAG